MIRHLTLLIMLLISGYGFAAQEQLLVYSANLDGELEPCGCSLESDYGGISRRASYLDRLRETDPELILISAGGLFTTELGDDSIKNRYILSGLEQLDYDALGVQWADLIHGIEFLTRSNLPFTAANWSDSQLSDARIIQRGEQSLYFTQWLDPQSSPYQAMPALSPISTDSAPLQKQLTEAKARGMTTLLATTLPLEQVRQQFSLEAVDILMVRSAYEEYGSPYMEAGTLVLQAGSRGQRLGLLRFDTDGAGNIRQWRHEVAELSDQIADAPRLAQWYERYNEELRQAFEQEMQLMQAQDQGERPFGGEQLCQACHQQAHQRWQESEHAKAWEDLEAVGKAFDPHCVGCHVVGYKQPGGFLSMQLTPELAGVQCENCHGAGQEHAQSGGTQKTPNHGQSKQQICGQCHVPGHSPSFQVESYWPQIEHGKESGNTR